MTLDEFRKDAHQGCCSFCYGQTSIRLFNVTPGTQGLCFVCSQIPGLINIQPDQRWFLAAAMVVIDAVKPPKKPRKPKEEPTGPVVRPMTRRKR